LFVDVWNHPLVIPTSLLRKLEFPTKSQLQAGSLSTAFPTPLTLGSFLAEAKRKRTFTNFPMAHHNLGCSRATPSHLGGFTSKSNKCYEDCFTKIKCSSAQKEDLTQPKLGFLTNHTNLTENPLKEGWGKLLYLSPKKLAVEN
jgi:hypothetical protein